MGLHGLGLFEGITEQELRQMQRCFEAYFQSYQAGERIRRYGEGNVVGVLASGTAAVCRIDADGSKTVLEYLRENGVFGEMLAFSSAEDLELICIKPCRVMFIDYRHIVRRCEKACVHHSRLVANMLRLLSEKSRALSERVEILSQRSTRS